MAQSSSDLTTIHLKRLATPGRKYYGDNERVYLGTLTGRLKLLTLSTDTVSGLSTPNITNNITNIVNNILSSGVFTSQSGIIAHAGGGQLNATQLTCDYNRIDAVITAGDSVKTRNGTGLTTIVQSIRNFDAVNDMNLYPYLGNRFKGMAVNVPLSIATGNGIDIICYVGEPGIWTF